MIKKITVITVVAVLCLFFKATAQNGITSVTATSGHALPSGEGWAGAIGDKLPASFWDTPMQILENGQVRTTTLNIYRGKSIIIDFWATHCSPCIAAFPKLGQLQKEFAPKIVFLGVATSEAKELKPFFERQGVLGFPTVIADQFLNNLFKHTLIPHEVWINDQGILVGLSSAEKINAESIRQFIAKGMLKTEMKIDQDLSKPLFVSTLMPYGRLLNYSILLKGHLEGTGSSNVQINLPDVVGINLSNKPLINLIERIGKMKIPHFNQKLLKMSKADSIELWVGDRKGDVRTRWYKQNEFTLCVAVGKSNVAKLSDIMLQLLNEQSGYAITLEDQKVNCLLLRLKSGFTLKPAAGDMENDLSEPAKRRLRNGKLSFFVEWLNEKDNSLPLVIDDTGINYGINLEVDQLDEAGLRQGLEKQGYEFVRAERVMTVISIKKIINN